MPIHGFVLLSPHISQVVTPIISLTHIKSCWGNFESKIFYLTFISPLCGRHSHPIIVNLYCNIFNKIQPSSSPSWIHPFERRFHSHGRSLIVIEKILFWKFICGVKNFWGKNIVNPYHPTVSTWKGESHFHQSFRFQSMTLDSIDLHDLLVFYPSSQKFFTPMICQ